jgi:hypothetical protein
MANDRSGDDRPGQIADAEKQDVLEIRSYDSVLTGTGTFIYDGSAQLGTPVPAVFNQEGKQAAHFAHVGEVADASPFPPASDQAGAGQNRVVGQHHILANPEGVAGVASQRAHHSGLDEQAC